MTLEMRELRGDDLFTVLSIIGKLDIKDDLMKALSGAPEGSLTAEEIDLRGQNIMASLMQTVLKNISLVKNDVNGLLADLCGVDVKVIHELGLVEYGKLIKDFAKKEELKGFLSSITSLMD
jgi:hypothetical protein